MASNWNTVDGNVKPAATLNSLADSYEVKHTLTVRASDPIPSYSLTEVEAYTHTKARRGFIYNSPGVRQQADGQTKAGTCSQWVLLSNEKGGSADTRNVTDKTHKHDVKGKEPGTHCCIPFI